MSQQLLSNIIPESIKTTFGMAPSLPKTYKAAVFKAKGEKLTIEDQELKEPVAGEVLIKVEACGVCHSDSMVQQASMGSPL